MKCLVDSDGRYLYRQIECIYVLLALSLELYRLVIYDSLYIKENSITSTNIKSANVLVSINIMSIEKM